MEIETTCGRIDEAELVKREYIEHGLTVTEYYLGDRLVHRSASVSVGGVGAAGKAKDLTRPADA